MLKLVPKYQQIKYQQGGNFTTGKDQHRDDRVKLINHPTYPKRGRFRNE